MWNGRRDQRRSNQGLKRREFLQAGGLGVLGLGLGAAPNALARGTAADRSVILLMLVGGPSQIDTFDPKPDAPSDVRGPFRSIATAVPGVRVCEHLPRLAHRLDRVTLVRSVHHDAAPIHETGYQLVQTGQLSRPDTDHPHIGSLAARDLGPLRGAPAFVVLPRALGNTGVGVWRGQSAGPLGTAFDPVVMAPEKGHSGAYGPTEFGRSCHLARKLVERGTRFVTVNMYDTVFNQVSWDCHGSRHFSTLDDYAREVLPTFDRAYTALIDDLEERGLLESTLVVATGEFGRGPRMNASGGRDHWPGVWSALLAGGDSGRGQVIGRSDALGGEPANHPVGANELAALMATHLRLSLSPTQG